MRDEMEREREALVSACEQERLARETEAARATEEREHEREDWEAHKALLLQEILELETRHKQLLDHVSSPLLLAQKLSVTAGAMLLPIHPRRPSSPRSSRPSSSSPPSHKCSGGPQDRCMEP